MTSAKPQDRLASTNQIHVKHLKTIFTHAEQNHLPEKKNDGKLSSIFLRCRIVNNSDFYLDMWAAF